MKGMPAVSLRGRVVDRGRGRVGSASGIQVGILESEVRRRTTGHNVTQSGEIASLWAAAKHGLLFTVAYAGLAN